MNKIDLEKMIPLYQFNKLANAIILFLGSFLYLYKHVIYNFQMKIEFNNFYKQRSQFNAFFMSTLNDSKNFKLIFFSVKMEDLNVYRRIFSQN